MIRLRLGFCPLRLILGGIRVGGVIIVVGIICHLRYSRDRCRYVFLSIRIAICLITVSISDLLIQWSYAVSHNYS